MTDDEFQAFVDDCFGQLEQKQADLQRVYGIGSFPRWHLDQTTEKLQFFDASDQLAVEASVINIGSFAANSNTWKWAWANDSVPSSLRQKAEPLQALAAITGYEFFSSVDAVSVEDENMVWEVVAMSVHQLKALGAYRAPSSAKPLAMFLGITSIEQVSRREP